MKRKIVAIVSIILVLIMISLYYTYAIDVSMEQTSGSADLTYNIDINDTSGRTVTVKAGKTKLFDIFVTNNNSVNMNYGLAYNGVTTEGITIAQVNTSKNKASELIDKNTTHQVTLVIINETDSDVTYNIIPVTGYEKGGDLIVPEGYTLISEIYRFPSNLDTSGANNPKLADNMIPITYNGESWIKADSTNMNEEYKWYDYGNKQWANAVLVGKSKTQAVDLSGNGNNGVISGATYTDEGLSFDGVDDYIVIENIDYNSSTAITIDFVGRISESDIGVILESSINSNNNSGSFYIDTNEYGANDMTLAMKYGTLKNHKMVNNLLAQDSLRQYTIVFDSTKAFDNFIQMYLDAQSQTVATAGGLASDLSNQTLSNYPLYIGSRAGSSLFTQMLLKEFRIYNRALTSEEIANNKNGNISQDGLIVNYDFSNIRDYYKNSDVGTEVKEEDILAYYVWVPRYKYKVFNITKTIGTDSYDAQTTGIDIVFESGTNSTGTVSCNYDFTITDGSLSETCSGANGDYYTHPAFTFGNTELTGIWVGKYEISSPPDSICYIEDSMNDCLGTTLSLRIKPTANAWRYNYLNNVNNVIQNMQVDNNEYGLTTDKTKADSHMIKNIEYGAIVYFTNSKYGRCDDEGCSEVSLNSNKTYVTGCGPQSEGSTDPGTLCNEYNTELGQLASTTGNTYGIYDINGCSYELVMGNMSSTSSTYTYFQSSAYSGFTYSETTAKYLDTYAYGTTLTDQMAYNRSRLGDAMGEISTTSGYGWYNDPIEFVNLSDSDASWFQRGARNYSKTNSGIFYSEANIGNSSASSSRAVLSVIK